MAINLVLKFLYICEGSVGRCLYVQSRIYEVFNQLSKIRIYSRRNAKRNQIQKS